MSPVHQSFIENASKRRESDTLQAMIEDVSQEVAARQDFLQTH